MKMRVFGWMAVLLAVTAVTAVAQEDRFAGIEITSEPVAGAVHMLTGAGGNIGVSVGDDGIVIVDDQYAPMAPKITAALHELSAGPIKYIVNTHFHDDHTGGNPVFGAEGPIVAHDNVRVRLARKPRIEAQALPSITYAQSVSLHVNGEEIRIVHFPAGHTDTDSVVFFTGSKVIHMGDHFFNGMFPFIDLGAGGSVEGYAANVGQVIAMAEPDVRIIPGHGPQGTLDDLKAFHGMLTECIGLVKAAIAAGTDLDGVRAAGIPEAYGSYGDGFVSTDRWIATLYRGLGGE